MSDLGGKETLNHLTPSDIDVWSQVEGRAGKIVSPTLKLPRKLRSGERFEHPLGYFSVTLTGAYFLMLRELATS